MAELRIKVNTQELDLLTQVATAMGVEVEDALIELASQAAEDYLDDLDDEEGDEAEDEEEDARPTAKATRKR